MGYGLVVIRFLHLNEQDGESSYSINVHLIGMFF